MKWNHAVHHSVNVLTSKEYKPDYQQWTERHKPELLAQLNADRERQYVESLLEEHKQELEKDRDARKIVAMKMKPATEETTISLVGGLLEFKTVENVANKKRDVVVKQQLFGKILKTALNIIQTASTVSVTTKNKPATLSITTLGKVDKKGITTGTANAALGPD